MSEKIKSTYGCGKEFDVKSLTALAAAATVAATVGIIGAGPASAGTYVTPEQTCPVANRLDYGVKGTYDKGGTNAKITAVDWRVLGVNGLKPAPVREVSVLGETYSRHYVLPGGYTTGHLLTGSFPYEVRDVSVYVVLFSDSNYTELCHVFLHSN